jgi:outer membrane immunogenic protein
MIRKLALAAFSFAMLDGAGAFAADMAVKAPSMPIAPPFNWTGCYIGGHFGGAFGRKELSDDDFTTLGFSSVSADTGGFLPGGQIGCNYQGFGNWVVGVEGSISAFTMKGETQFPDGSDFTVKGNWVASATGRIGYAWNPWLFYVDGGAAWVHENYDFSNTSLTPGFDFITSDTRTGWTLGFGLEYVFWGNWSADLNYSHYGFGTKNLTFVDSVSGSSAIGSTKQWFDTITLGLNYHFGGSWQPAAPEAAENDSQRETIAIDGGVTYTNPYSLYGDLALLWGPGGLDNSGVRFRAATVDGAYSFLENGTFGQRLYGNSEEVTGMVGYEFVQGTTSLLLMTGANYVTSSSQTGPAGTTSTSNPFPGNAGGWKSLIELYSNPTDKTMVEVEGTYSTAFREYYTQYEVGYALWAPEIYIGPQAVLLGDESFDQYRLGAFISGFKVGKVELGVSGGYLHDRQQGSGYYVGTDFYVRY